MEKWQHAHIRKNLPILIENTKCSAGFKARLKANEILSDEEDERLTAIGRNYGSRNEAKEFYEIIVTKPGSYNVLIEVLKDTRQHGAVKILQVDLPVQLDSSDFSYDPVKQLRELYIQISGVTKPLREVFPKITSNDALMLVSDTDIREELQDMFLNKSTILLLDEDLPISPEHYIPRLVSNRLQLNPAIFNSDHCDDVFVFKNMDRSDLCQLAGFNAVRSSLSQRSLITSRHIYLDNDEDWDDLALVSDQPIHLVCKEGDKYLLQRTTKVTDVLLDNVSHQMRNKEAFITEEALVDKICSDNSSKGVLVCDVPGMGKTCLMKNLALRIREKSKNAVVFFFELLHFSRYLATVNPTSDMNQGLKVVIDYSCRSKLADNLLYQHAANNGILIVLVLDGFDEISQSGIEITKLILTSLSKHDNVRIIMSSRPNMRADLQKCFGLISYDILPFGREEQINFLVTKWQRVCPEAKLQILKTFGKQCTEAVKFIQKNDGHDILGVPLKCQILAAVNETKAIQLCKPNRCQPLEVPEIVAVKSVFDLYEMFVNTSVEKVLQKMENSEKAKLRSLISSFHTYMALQLLLPEISAAYKSCHHVDTSIETIVLSVGIVSYNKNKQNLQFTHKSFAEFLVGKFFAQFWNNIEEYPPGFVGNIGNCFLQKVLRINDEYEQSEVFKTSVCFNDFYNFGDFLRFKTHGQFKHFTSLSFLNSALHHHKLQSSCRILKNVYISQKQDLNPRKDKMDENIQKLRAAAFITMTACIDDGFASVLSLIVHLFMTFSNEGESFASLCTSYFPTKNSEDWAPWLLCRVALSSCPENAVEIFRLFGYGSDNYLLKLCQNYPESMWSPLEVSIQQNDLDMVEYFADKLKHSWHRLFMICLLVPYRLEERDIEKRIIIMERVLGSSENVKKLLSEDIASHCPHLLDVYPFIFQIRIVTTYLANCSHKFTSVSVRNKRFFLKQCLQDSTDEELMIMLLTLFGRNDNESVPKNLCSSSCLEAKRTVLQGLELKMARETFVYFRFKDEHHEGFRNCSSLATLLVISAVLPDFSYYNHDKWNYLHYAVFKRNTGWIKHLISSGCDIDQRDKNGNTPLLCAFQSDKLDHLLEITRLLVENGADVYAHNSRMQNVAHIIFSGWQYAEIEDMCDWVTYSLEKGFHALWKIQDGMGMTPQDTLIGRAGKSHPMTTAVMRLLKIGDNQPENV